MIFGNLFFGDIFIYITSFFKSPDYRSLHERIESVGDLDDMIKSVKFKVLRIDIRKLNIT